MGKNGDVNQEISGYQNTQINSENDTIAAIGSGAMAAGRDIIIHSKDEETVKIYARQIELLEEALKNAKMETENERKRAYALEASLIAEEMSKHKEVEFSASMLYSAAEASKMAGRLDVAEGQYKQAYRHFKRVGDMYHVGGCYSGLFHLAMLQGNTDKAEHYSQQSHEIAKELDDKHAIAISYIAKGMLARKKGELNQAQQLQRNALKVAQNIGDQETQARAINNLAIVLEEVGKIDDANRYYQQCLELNRSLDDVQGIAGTLGNLAALASDREEYSMAEELYLESQLLQDQIGDSVGKTITTFNLGMLYERIEQYKKAEGYYQDCIQMSREFGLEEIEFQSQRAIEVISYKQRQNHDANDL